MVTTVADTIIGILNPSASFVPMTLSIHGHAREITIGTGAPYYTLRFYFDAVSDALEYEIMAW